MSEARGEEFQVRAGARLPALVLKELTRLSPVRATLSLATTWGTIAVLVALAVRYPHPGIIAGCVVGIAAQQHALAILTHQAAHYRMYRRRWLNDLAGKLCAWPTGASMLTYRIIHRTHHNHLYSPIDPDLALMAGYPRGRWYLIRKLTKDLFGLTVVKNQRYFFGKPNGAQVTNDDTSPALRAAARRDRHATTLVQVALLGASIALGVWSWYLLLWMLPLLTVLQAILRLRAICEHGAVPDTSSPLTAARTNLVSWSIRWILFPFNMNFHIEHHLYPAVPHYRLPACHRAMVEHGLLGGAEVVRGVGATARKIFAARA
ncbi:MAG TPA: fatty acid desaturase family protein [Kofleriaceae bacterium]|nr:fatty acid desaturase family protein [Kofleriaceae bacterium]